MAAVFSEEDSTSVRGAGVGSTGGAGRGGRRLANPGERGRASGWGRAPQLVSGSDGGLSYILHLDRCIARLGNARKRSPSRLDAGVEGGETR